MFLKKLAKTLLFPHISVLLLLLPFSSGALAVSFLFLEEKNPLRIASYAVSFYTLIAWCARVPGLVRSFRNWKDRNKYAQLWIQDARLRINVTLFGNSVWNSAYGFLQLGLGIYHRSFWFCSLAGYYFSLALMRIFLARHTARYRPGEKMRTELRRYRACGFVFLLTNLALSAMIFFMMRGNGLAEHHEITTIAMAAYTFASLTTAVIGAIRYRRYKNPVFSASKTISLAAACVSMLTLEATMLTTFGNESMPPQMRERFLFLGGGTVSLLIVAIAVYMIAKANTNLKGLEKER